MVNVARDLSMDIEINESALALPEGRNLADIFRRPKGIEGLLSRIEQEARSHAPDLTTAKGRDAIKSLAFKVSRTKTALDAAGKDLNEEARAQINAVDAERRMVRERLDKLRDEVRKPLDDWEAAEAARVDAIKARLDRLRTAPGRLAEEMLPNSATSQQIGALLGRVEVVALDDTWAEFAAEAARYKEQAIATLRHMLAEAKAREAAQAEAARQAAELEQLRAEKAAREEADRIAREAAEEAERKRVAAEQAEQARIAAEKAEAERAARFEREKQEAAARAAQEAERQAKEREAALRAQIEAERAREEQARREAEIRHARELAAAQAERDRAAQAERDRIAAQERAEAHARAKREADQAHRALIHRAIANALRTMEGAATPELIAEALMQGRIPHCKVEL